MDGQLKQASVGDHFARWAEDTAALRGRLALELEQQHKARADADNKLGDLRQMIEHIDKLTAPTVDVGLASYSNNNAIYGQLGSTKAR